MHPMPGHGYAVPRHPSSGLSVASMVTGIVSIVLCWTVIFSIPLGILALIFGFIGKSKGGKGMAIAGIITGAIGLLLTVIILIAAFSAGDSDVRHRLKHHERHFRNRDYARCATFFVRSSRSDH